MRFALVVGLLMAVGCAGRDGENGAQGLLGAQGPKGDKGDPGPGSSVPPNISSITPSRVAVGRTTDVMITGYATQWTSSASVNFGAGVTVKKVQAASPSAINVTIEVSPTAEPGTRDVFVSSQGQSTSFKGLFRIVPTVQATVLGTPARGGVALVRVLSNDPQVVFDSTWALVNPTYPNYGSHYTGVQFSVSPDAELKVLTVRPTEVSVLVTGDIDAPMGARELRLTNSVGKPDEQSYTFPMMYEMGELQDNPITGPVNGTIDDAYQSKLYSVTTSNVNEKIAWASAPQGNPQLVPLPPQGKFLTSDAGVVLTNSYTLVPYGTSDPMRFIVFDPSGTAGYEYSFTVADLPKITEAEPNDNKEVAQPVNTPTSVSAKIGTQSDADWFKVTIAESDVGRRIHVRTRPQPTSYCYSLYCDQKIEILQPDGASMFAGPADSADFEDLRSPPTTASGDYYVRITWGDQGGYYYVYYATYEAVINVE